MSEKLLSIIVPSYNMEKYLHKCLSSLIIEPGKLDKLDVIVVNDGSTDHTSEIAHEFEAKYPGVFRVIDKANGHYGSCVNAALKSSSGTYIKMLDADDWYNTDGFAKFVDFLASDKCADADVILNDTCGFCPGSGFTNTPKLNLPQGRFIAPCELLNSRSIILGLVSLTVKTCLLKSINYFQTERKPYTDSEWMTFSWCLANTVVYCPELVYIARNDRPGQTMNPKTYANSYNIVVDLVRGMMRDYDKYTSKSNDAQKQIVFDKIMLLVDGVYTTGIFGYGGHKANFDLSAFDAKVKTAYAKFFEAARCETKLLWKKIDVLPLWRKHRVAFSFLLAILSMQSFCRGICGKIKRAGKEVIEKKIVTGGGGQTSWKIANMSIFCAFLVVAIHCHLEDFDSGIAALFCRVFANGLCRIAVPFFFITSGYFLAKHIDEEGWWKRETLKRVMSLIVPFLCWAFIYQIICIPLSLYADFSVGRPMWTTIASDIFNPTIIGKHGYSEILKCFGLLPLEPTSTTHLWFLRSLFMTVLVSPIIFKGLRKLGLSFIGLLIASTYMLSYIPGLCGEWIRGIFGISLSINGAIYFAIGAWLRMSGFAFHSKKLAIVSAIIGMSILAFNGSLFEYAAPFLLFAVWEFMPSCEWPAWLTRTSFAVYLMHYAFISYCLVAARNLGIGEGVGNVIAWPIAFIGSVIAANIGWRLTPKLSGILFGGRCL